MPHKLLSILISITLSSSLLMAQPKDSVDRFICSTVDPELNNSNKAAMYNDYRWEKGQKLRIYFLDGNSFQKSTVKKHAVEWAKYCSLKFEFVDKLPAEIRITFKKKGYWSKLGTASLASGILGQNIPSMNFESFNEEISSSGIKRAILHEFGHALGLVHEHQSPVSPLKFKIPYIYTYFHSNYGWSKEQVNHNIINRYTKTKITNSKFDPLSIMLYELPADILINPDQETNLNYDLSELDKSFIKAYYNKPKPKPVIREVNDNRRDGVNPKMRTGFYISSYKETMLLTEKIKLIYKATTDSPNGSLKIQFKNAVSENDNYTFIGWMPYMQFESKSPDGNNLSISNVSADLEILFPLILAKGIEEVDFSVINVSGGEWYIQLGNEEPILLKNKSE